MSFYKGRSALSNNALIGFSGFVGSTILKQIEFSNLYRSTNISEIQGKIFDAVVCAGVPAVKWKANKDPEADKENISSLMECLSNISCDQFILISTVDVFKDPVGVVESTAIETQNLHPYGLHRYELEEFVKEKFKRCLIIRLPGLVGTGLKKNILFDFLNGNDVDSIDSRGVFQFYPVAYLWNDVQVALTHNLSLVHLTAEPVSVKEVAKECFSMEFSQVKEQVPPKYDFKTEYSRLYEKNIDYQYSKEDSLECIREYIRIESR